MLGATRPRADARVYAHRQIPPRAHGCLCRTAGGALRCVINRNAQSSVQQFQFFAGVPTYGEVPAGNDEDDEASSANSNTASTGTVASALLASQPVRASVRRAAVRCPLLVRWPQLTPRNKRPPSSAFEAVGASGVEVYRDRIYPNALLGEVLLDLSHSIDDIVRMIGAELLGDASARRCANRTFVRSRCFVTHCHPPSSKKSTTTTPLSLCGKT